MCYILNNPGIDNLPSINIGIVLGTFCHTPPHICPLSAPLLHTPHPRFCSTSHLHPTLTSTSRLYYLSFYFVPIRPCMCTRSTLLAILFLFSVHTAEFCTPFNTRTTLGARGTLMLHVFIVEILFCKFCFCFRALFIAISHDFRILR